MGIITGFFPPEFVQVLRFCMQIHQIAGMGDAGREGVRMEEARGGWVG
jgi:hypothetical protein